MNSAHFALNKKTTTFIFLFLYLSCRVSGYGSMSSVAISYGDKGSALCRLKSDGSHSPDCRGSNQALIQSTPKDSTFIGLTGGNGFICGLLMESSKPFCWGSANFIHIIGKGKKLSEYLEISAGDNHLCGLRKPLFRNGRNISLIDCWGNNMTRSYRFDEITSISSGSVFNCGLFAQNRSVFCWSDMDGGGVIKWRPKAFELKKIDVGGFNVCGSLKDSFISSVICWGRNFDIGYAIYSGKIDIGFSQNELMVSVVGGKIHACGIRSHDKGVVCWGFSARKSTPSLKGVKFYEIGAGDYVSCGSDRSRSSACWGVGIRLPVNGNKPFCETNPCSPGFYEFNNVSELCTLPGSHICLPCSKGCPKDMYQIAECSLSLDTQCAYNCSSCSSNECIMECSSNAGNILNTKLWLFQMPLAFAETFLAVVLIIAIVLSTLLYIRYRSRKCECPPESNANSGNVNGSLHEGIDENHKTQHDLDELKIRRAHMFTFEELKRATNGFREESLVGKGSFSCVYKGFLEDGTIVAVKRAIAFRNLQKNSNEFQTELDLLSRLNHAHLLNLLGYCEEGDERLLVYEFMANGSLHQHLHSKEREVKARLDWVKWATIAVQASRGLEYLHGYACPPVIHRDIKSSNVLIDEEHNARIADFGLSLLVPADSGAPLSELPAGTLGYLDPEYYRLHYLTTKSDVYSFGVLLLEILSGRKAIDMKYEQGNIVEWAVPLIESRNIEAVLDPVLKRPSDVEALKRISCLACKCVRMRGRDRPSMDKVTTDLERALAVLICGHSSEQPILPTEVVLGSSRLHKKSSRRSINRLVSEKDGSEMADRRIEFRGRSWTSFHSGSSSQMRRTSFSESDRDGEVVEMRNVEEEIGRASPQEHLYLQHDSNGV